MNVMNAYGGPTNDPFSEREESPQLHQKYIRNHLIPYNRDMETQPYEPYTKGIEIKEDEIPTYRLGDSLTDRTPIVLSVPEPPPPSVPEQNQLPEPFVGKSQEPTMQEGYACPTTNSDNRVQGVYVTIIVILLIVILFLIKKLYNLP